jgi:hypothetical protein
MQGQALPGFFRKERLMSFRVRHLVLPAALAAALALGGCADTDNGGLETTPGTEANLDFNPEVTDEENVSE